jgi:hypothetical protein
LSGIAFPTLGIMKMLQNVSKVVSFQVQKKYLMLKQFIQGSAIFNLPYFYSVSATQNLKQLEFSRRSGKNYHYKKRKILLKYQHCSTGSINFIPSHICLFKVYITLYYHPSKCKGFNSSSLQEAKIFGICFSEIW